MVLVGSTSDHTSLYKAEGDLIQAQERKQCRHGGRDWSDVATSQGMPVAIINWRGKEWIFPESPKGPVAPRTHGFSSESDADCELTSGTVKNKFLQFQVQRLLPSSSEETKHSILANACENLQLLCQTHHRRIHMLDGKMSLLPEAKEILTWAKRRN